MRWVVVTVQYHRTNEVDLVGERDQDEDKEVGDEPHLGRDEGTLVA